MKFLTVLIVLGLHRNWVGENPLREQFQVERWFSWIDERISPGSTRFFFSVVAPALLLLLLSMELSGWFLGIFWLALSLLVVFYCIDMVDTKQAFDDQVDWVRSLSEDDDLSQMQQIQSNFCGDITYEVFQAVGPVLFWFLLLGPAGALLFVLCQRYLEVLEGDDSQVDLLQLILFWMEWVPARMTIFLFALLGEFGRTWEVLLESITDVESPVLTTLQSAVNPVAPLIETRGFESFKIETETELAVLKDLLERSLWGWAGIAALLTIAGF